MGAGTLPGDLFGADPPAHYATGVMLHDFLRHPGARPLPFAECFYVKYPKVALGHWPPVFYVLEAFWFFLFGTTVTAARWLCACIAAACGLAVFSAISRRWGYWHGITFAAVFLGTRLVQREAWRVMSDLLLALFVLLALLRLAEFLSGGKRRDAVMFAAWSVLAILTKGTGWLLLIAFGVAPLATWRTRVYLRPAYWIAGMSICAASVPFFVWSGAAGFGYPLKFRGLIYRLTVIAAGLRPLHYAAIAAGLGVIAVSLYSLRRRSAPKPKGVERIILLLWIASQAVLIVLAPLTPELARYMIPSIAPALVLLAGVAAASEQRIPEQAALFRAVVMILCAGAIVIAGRVPLYQTTAFSEAAAAIPSGKERVVLVSSDSAGEGAVIASRLEMDPHRSTYILRESKLLSRSEWSGRQYSLRYPDTASLREALDNNMVDYVILDHSAPPTPGSRLLNAALHEESWKWAEAARIPVNLANRHGELLVYRREAAPPTGTTRFSVQLGPERAERVLTCEQPVTRN